MMKSKRVCLQAPTKTILYNSRNLNHYHSQIKRKRVSYRRKRNKIRGRNKKNRKRKRAKR